MPAIGSANKPAQFIDDNESLQKCLEALSAHDTLGFDLEFDSHRNAYGVTLCLIQVATPDTCFVIDPLLEIDLNSLWSVFEDERVQKIVHSPGEDLRLLHSIGCFPKNLFDTEVVAKLLNYEQTSLSAMLSAKLGYSLNKSQQRSNWLRRPLSEEQIIYAAEDVAGLHALKGLLIEEASSKGLMPFVEEEQAALSTTIHQPERKGMFLKAGDINNLSPYDQHILNGLFRHRDELARGLNRPAFQVMDEAVVRGLADRSITPQDAPFQKGVYGGYRNERFGRELSDYLQQLHAEAEAQQLSKKRPPRQFGPESRMDRALMAEQKEALFTPIQQVLVTRFGEHAARFILSNGAVNDMLKGMLKISAIKRKYKQELVLQAASELDIDLSAFQ